LKPPLVSAIISAYNSEKFIKAAIESILNQSYSNLEIIVFDDISTDSTIPICELFLNLENFRLIKANEHTGNIAKARNYSIEIANGEYVAFLDSDDLWEPDKIEKQMKYIEEFPIICSDAKIVDENNKILSESYFAKFGYINDVNLERLLLDNLVITSSVLAKKELIINSGKFSEEQGFFAEDYALWLNIVKQHTIKFISSPLIRYRRHIGNGSYVYRAKLLLESIHLKNLFVSDKDIKLKKAAIKSIIEIKTELTGIYLRNNMFRSSFQNMFYVLWYFTPKLSVRYLKFYIKFIYLLLKKLFIGVFTSKK